MTATRESRIGWLIRNRALWMDEGAPFAGLGEGLSSVGEVRRKLALAMKKDGLYSQNTVLAEIVWGLGSLLLAAVNRHNQNTKVLRHG